MRAARDSPPEVRYYAAFALGASGATSVIPLLREMTRDNARSSAFVGSVGEEAQAAIDHIKGSHK